MKDEGMKGADRGSSAQGKRWLNRNAYAWCPAPLPFRAPAYLSARYKHILKAPKSWAGNRTGPCGIKLILDLKVVPAMERARPHTVYMGA